MTAESNGEMRLAAPVGGRLDTRQRRRAEPQVGTLRGDRIVQRAEHLARRVVRRGARAHRVARERRQRGGLRPLAANAADPGGPGAGAAAEDVVEVAADLVCLAGGEEARGCLEALDLR